MTENNNSFETVELLEPISLMSIDGSDLTGINVEAETSQTDAKAESGTAQVNAKNEAKTPQAPVEAAGKFADDTVSPYKHTDAENYMDADDYADMNNTADTGFEQNFNNEYNYSNNAPHRILVDPKKLFGSAQASSEKQDYQKPKYNAKFVLFCVIGICLLTTVLMAIRFQNAVKQSVANSANNAKNVLQDEDGSRFIYTGGSDMNDEPVYTTIYFNSSAIDADLPVEINARCIEYTDSGTRGLFFTATTTEKNIGTIINVTMMDKRGNILGVASNSNCDVAVGDEYMIPMFFNLSPEYDMNGVTYKIKAETYKVKEYPMIRTITDVTEAGKGQFLITYEGTPGYMVTTYVVLYKDGDVVDVLVGTGLIDETGEVVIDASKAGVDYDRYKVYY